MTETEEMEMNKPHVTEYREIVQLDSFGDLNRDGFDKMLDHYKVAAQSEFPQAEINITVSETVGCSPVPHGHNRVVWSDGEEEELTVYSWRIFQAALRRHNND